MNPEADLEADTNGEQAPRSKNCVLVAMVTTSATPQAWPEGTFDLVTLTSQRAVQFLPPGFMIKLRQFPTATFSARTATALQAVGIAPTLYHSANTATAFAEQLAAQQPAAKNILLLGAKELAAPWQEILGKAGIKLTHLALYETRPRSDFNATELAALLDPKALYVVFSPSAARAIDACLKQHQTPLKQQSFAVIGATTELEVKKLWPQAVVHKAEQPNVAALRRLVAQLRPDV